jgi:hypothetical protein
VAAWSDAGAPGAPGGQGGPGGGGGGGAGGPSAGVFRTGAASSYTPRTSHEDAATSGAGGSSPGTGQRAASGVAAPVLRAPSAPAGTTTDFDEDGIADAVDACPDASGAGRDGDGDGCSDRGAALADGDGDEIPDAVDRCPQSRRGTDLDEDGCPDAPPTNPTVVTVPPRTIVPATVSYHYTKITRRVAIFDRLQVKHVPSRSRIDVRCTGSGCPVKRYTRTGSGTVDLRPYVRRKLRVGTVLEIRITTARMIGIVKYVRIRALKEPAIGTRCLSSAGRPTACPSGPG